MSTEYTARLVELRRIVADVLEVSPEEISNTSLLMEEHGADSMKAIEILALLERRYDIEIPHDEFATAKCLLDIYQVVKRTADWTD